MPTITVTDYETDGGAQPQSRADERQVPAGCTCLTQCLHSIPPGVITVTLPGVSIFVVGVVLLALTVSATDQSNPADGLSLVAIITVAVGGGWTVLAVGFWVIVCCRYYRLRATHDTATKQHSAGRKLSVELVGVSWRDDTLHSYSFHDKSLDRTGYYKCID